MMSKKVIIGVIVALLVGIGGGYFAFDYAKKQSSDGGPNVASEQIATPPPADASSTAEPQTVAADIAQDQTYDGLVNFLPSRAGESAVVGGVLNFSTTLQNDRSLFEKEQLPGIRLEPNYDFRGRWISDRQFEILIKDQEKPRDQVQVTVTEIPLTGEAKLTLMGKAQGPWTLIYPEVALQSAVVSEFSPNLRAEIELHWNYEVQGKDIGDHIAAKYVDSQGKESLLSDIKINVNPTGYAKSHTLRVFSKQLAPGSLRLTLAKELQTKGGQMSNPQINQMLVLSPPERLTIDEIRAVEGSDSFSIQATCSINSERYYRACRVNADTAKNLITVDPPVNFSVVSGGGKFTLVGGFQPQEAYRISIKKGLQANDTAILDQPYEYTVRTGSYKSTFRFIGKARYLPSLTMTSIPYEARNVKNIKVTIHQIFPQNLIFWLTQYGDGANTQVAEVIKEFELTLDVKDDQKIKGDIELGEFNPVGKGLFAVQVEEIKKANYNRTLDNATVIVTDIAAVVKQTRDDIIVYARSMTDLAPLSGVEVKAMTQANRTIATCTVNNDSGCVLKGVMNQKFEPYALVLSKADDLSYVRFSDVEIVDNRVHAGTRPFTQKDVPLESYIYTSRGVYRPGETAHVSSLTRTGDRQAASNVPVQWKIKTPRGKTLREEGVKTSKHGFATIDVKMSSYAETGEYIAELWTGEKLVSSKSFLVEEFVPERIGLKVAPAQPVYNNLSIPSFALDAKFLFGPPVADGAYKVRCSLAPAFFTIPGKEEFATGQFSQETYQAISFDAQAGTLDENGLATVPCDYTTASTSSFPTVMRLTASAEIQEAGSGRVTKRASTALITPSDTLLGLRKVDAQNSQIKVEARLFDPQGNQITDDRSVKVSMYRLESDWIYGYDPDYGYERWRQEEYLLPDGTSKVVPIKDGKADIELATSRTWGRFIVRAEDQETGAIADIKVSMGYYWYWGGGYDSTETPAARDADQVRVDIDKKEVAAGESFAVSFEAPFDGVALITTETDQILEHKWVDVAKGQQKFTLTAPDVLPNLYVSALMIKNPTDGDLYIPARAYGAASVKVTPSEFRFSVDVETPDVMRPNNDLVVKLGTGNGEDTEYTVAIIDEGILQLTSFATPDPEGYFFEPRRLGTKLFETFGWTFSKTSEAGGDEAGKTDGDQGRVMPVRLVAHWSGVVKAEDGAAEVRYAVPPFQGKVRVMVVASSGQKMSKGETYVTIRDPLVVQPTFPRFLTDGDDIQVPVFVVNMTGEDHDVTVKLTANNSIYLDQTEQKATLKNNASNTFIFPAKVSDFEGTAAFEVVASAGSFVTEDDATIPIIPLTPEQTALVAQKGDKAFSVKDILPVGMRSKPVRLQASISTLPNLESFGQLRNLIRYPYGCVEQTTSATYPLVFMPEILEFVDPEMAKEFNIKDMVNSGISRLVNMQQTSGGFSYWPGGSGSINVWPSAYVTNLFLDAKQAGYSVPQTALDEALNFLRESVTTRRHNYSTAGEIDDAEPFVHFLLAKAKKPELNRLREIADNPPAWGHLNDENRFLVMAALKLAGEDKLMTNFAKTADSFSLASAGERRHTYTYWSSLRSDAMRLSLGEDVFPGDERLEILANHVATRLAQRDSWYSTQEMAWGVSALGKRMRRMKDVKLDGVSLAVNGKTLKTTLQNPKTPTWDLIGYDPAATVLKMNHNSPVDPYLYVRVVGYAQDYTLVKAQSTPVTLSRKYFSLDGGEIDTAAVKQGDLLVAELVLTNKTYSNVDNIAVVDRLPAGLEIENPRLGRSEAITWLPDDDVMFKPEYTDIRDDRIQIFGNLGYRYNSPLTQKYYYVARAVTAGQFNIPPAKVELMYDGEKYDYTDYGSMIIAAP